VVTTSPPSSEPADGAAPRWYPPREEATEVLLVRHGSTAHSLERKFSGRNDLPLDDRGVRQARAVAAHLAQLPKIDAVVTSPLRRARETAHIVAERIGGTVETHDDLIETDFGTWEGRTIEEAHALSPDVLGRWLKGGDVAPPNGESFGQVEHRVSRAVDDIVVRHEGQRIVVVSHLTPIKILLRLALGAPEQTMFRFQLDTASLSAISYFRDGTSAVQMINNAEHPEPADN
jgi:broad specificity phosphatase PhoE